jgi:hypothetical protein
MATGFKATPESGTIPAPRADFIQINAGTLPTPEGFYGYLQNGFFTAESGRRARIGSGNPGCAERKSDSWARADFIQVEPAPGQVIEFPWGFQTVRRIESGLGVGTAMPPDGPRRIRSEGGSGGLRVL